MTPEELRKQASATEFLAEVVSYGPDKARLRARAAELRSMAEALEVSPAGPPPERARRREALAVALRAMPRRLGRLG